VPQKQHHSRLIALTKCSDTRYKRAPSYQLLHYNWS